MTIEKRQSFKKRLIPIKKGTRFGQLIVISDIPIRSKTTSPNTGKNTYRAKWECICDCGSKRLVTGTKLRNGTCKSCASCSYKRRRQFKERVSPEQRLFNLTINQRERKTKGRVKNFLTLEEFKVIISKNCIYCGEPPSLISYDKNKIVENRELLANGIDRINNEQHYTLENSAPCCPTCNKMKGVLTATQFLNHIKKINKNFNE